MEGKDYELCFGLTASSPRPFLHTLNGQRRLLCWQGWRMFSLPTIWRCTNTSKVCDKYCWGSGGGGVWTQISQIAIP